MPTLSQNTAKRYEVSAMPTFVFFRNREKLDTVRESCSHVPRLSPHSGNEARELGTSSTCRVDIGERASLREFSFAVVKVMCVVCTASDDYRLKCG